MPWKRMAAVQFLPEASPASEMTFQITAVEKGAGGGLLQRFGSQDHKAFAMLQEKMRWESVFSQR